MPVYSFRDTETKEEYEATMRYSELDEYLKNNSHIVQIFTRFPGTVDSVRIGIRKPDDNFRVVLKKAKVHKHNTINDF
jgi:histidinol-phosphate/aromatic aminotransferase/cobyric acid decarboxylase-like protein